MSGSRLNGYALLSLQFHEVHLRTNVVTSLHLMDRPYTSPVEEDSLTERGLTTIDVCRYADVT